MALRPYQREAVEAVYEHLRTRDDNPCVVIPTGGGKTHVIAEICRDAVQRWNGRVLILAHVKELLEQAAEKLRLTAPDLPFGIYSAGLKQRDLGYPVTIAGIQSVYQRALDLGPADLVIVDEAHLIPPDGEGMYRRFLADARKLCNHQRVIGLTATPYRMKTGTICGPDNILNAICFEAGVRELIVRGYLSQLRSRGSGVRVDTSGLHVRAGEFVAGEAEDLMESVVEAACQDIVKQTNDRHSVLIFCAGVQHCEHVAETMRSLGVDCEFIEGDTPAKQRDELIDRFRRGELRYLANVNVLTTGFDAPNIDCVVLLRPTLSPGLYYQMCGRGFRLHPGKRDCLVLDYGGNVLRHGLVDAIRVRKQGSGAGEAPAKECPACHEIVHAGYSACPACGYEFPPPQRAQHTALASGEPITTLETWREEFQVDSVDYFIHIKRGAGGEPDYEAPPTMRVEYTCGMQLYREWICFEHSGYARAKAEQWWRARSREPVPATVEEAVELARAGALAPTRAITVERKAGERYDRIVDYELGDRPARLEDPNACPEYTDATYDIPSDEIPF